MLFHWASSASLRPSRAQVPDLKSKADERKKLGEGGLTRLSERTLLVNIREALMSKDTRAGKDAVVDV